MATIGTRLGRLLPFNTQIGTLASPQADLGIQESRFAQDSVVPRKGVRKLVASLTYVRFSITQNWMKFPPTMIKHDQAEQDPKPRNNERVDRHPD